jgi:hypothetical protein
MKQAVTPVKNIFTGNEITPKGQSENQRSDNPPSIKKSANTD